MLSIFRLIYAIVYAMLIGEKKKPKPPAKDPLPDNLVVTSKEWKSPPEYLDFVQFLQDETSVKEPFRILKQTILEYGELPHKFMLIQTEDKQIAMTFFIESDPEFSAIMFPLAKKFFRKQVDLISSYVYRPDNTICMTTDADFIENYTKFLTKDEPPVTLVTPSNKKFDLN